MSCESVSWEVNELPLSLFLDVPASLYTLAASSMSATVSIAERRGDPCSGCANTFEMLVAGWAASRELRHFGGLFESVERELWRRLWVEDEEDIEVSAEHVHLGCGVKGSIPNAELSELLFITGDNRVRRNYCRIAAQLDPLRQ